LRKGVLDKFQNVFSTGARRYKHILFLIWYRPALLKGMRRRFSDVQINLETSACLGTNSLQVAVIAKDERILEVSK